MKPQTKQALLDAIEELTKNTYQCYGHGLDEPTAYQSTPLKSLRGLQEKLIPYLNARLKQLRRP